MPLNNKYNNHQNKKQDKIKPHNRNKTFKNTLWSNNEILDDNKNIWA